MGPGSPAGRTVWSLLRETLGLVGEDSLKPQPNLFQLGSSRDYLAKSVFSYFTSCVQEPQGKTYFGDLVKLLSR